MERAIHMANRATDRATDRIVSAIDHIDTYNSSLRIANAIDGLKPILFFILCCLASIAGVLIAK